MDITWKYKIDVASLAVFQEIGQDRGVTFPDDLKSLILNTNAATPSACHYMVGNNERVLSSILSFNRNEIDTDSVFTAFLAVDDHNLIPFGIDPFGNYVCYSIKDGAIVFWDHETGVVSYTASSLEAFIGSLY